MTQPSTPKFQKEGPASPCVLHGHNLAWFNCTCLSCAMGLHKSLGHVVASGCQVRDETGDYVGGTRLTQMQKVATAHGVKTELHVGANVASLWYLAYQGSLGRGFQLDGNTSADGRGNVNHDIWVNNPVGGTPGNPTGFMVYDPWSDGPVVWSYAKLKAFMLALHPWGEGDPRTLKSMGVNGGYALLYPDTEPHVHLHYGAGRTSPFPDRMTAHSPAAGRRVNVRTRPDRLVKGDIAGTMANGALLSMYQVTHSGAKPPGSTSRTWYGSHDGNRWIHSSGVTGAGGAS